MILKTILILDFPLSKTEYCYCSFKYKNKKTLNYIENDCGTNSSPWKKLNIHKIFSVWSVHYNNQISLIKEEFFLMGGFIINEER